MLLTSVDDSVRSDNAVFCWIGFQDLEFDGPHSTSDQEGISLSKWSIGFQKVWL